MPVWAIIAIAVVLSAVVGTIAFSQAFPIAARLQKQKSAAPRKKPSVL